MKAENRREQIPVKPKDAETGIGSKPSPSQNNAIRGAPPDAGKVRMRRKRRKPFVL